MDKGAVFSSCNQHRLMLHRIWAADKPKALFIMHNPSKAGAEQDDRTVSKLIRYCRRWGYGGFYVGNIFSRIATDPEELKYVAPQDLVHPDSMAHIKTALDKADIGILAYGNISVALKVVKAIEVQLEFEDMPYWYCLSKTKLGHPGHPLYLPGSATPIPFGHDVKWVAPGTEEKQQTELML